MSQRGLRRISTVTLFGVSYFRHYLFLLPLKLQKIPNKSLQECPNTPSPKKPYNRALYLEERNTKHTFLRRLVNRVLNDEAGSNNNKMAYGYYPKFPKEYGSAVLS